MTNANKRDARMGKRLLSLEISTKDMKILFKTSLKKINGNGEVSYSYAFIHACHTHKHTCSVSAEPITNVKMHILFHCTIPVSSTSSIYIYI